MTLQNAPVIFFFVSCKSLPKEESMKLSKVTAELLDYIQKGVSSSPHTVVRTINALGSGPLAYRTFGGNVQNYAAIDEQALEKAFGSHYLLTMIAQGLIIRRILYPESGSCHTLYCDKAIYGFFARHGLLDCGVWSHVDYETLERNITPENTDYRIYYSYSKPDALLKEAELAGEQVPVFFVDTDLILKKRHDVIIPGAASVKAAYSHLEQIGGECYPPFASLHFPEGCKLPPVNESLPAVNTCLMFFNDKGLLREWGRFFKELFINNWIRGELAPEVISRQLLGIDQRTFPFVCDWRGIWGTPAVVPFLDIIWEPPFFIDCKTGRRAEWHYYTLEHHPEHPDWHQDIMHTWINKKNVERDAKFRRYQGLMMLEMIQALNPEAEKPLRTFASLREYFSLYDTGKGIETLLAEGVVSAKMDKSL